MPSTPSPTADKNEAQRSIGLLGVSIPLPSLGTALYYGGIATLVAAELIDWPVAVAVAVGHELLTRRQPPATTRARGRTPKTA
jgi:hypothetical protein